MAVEGQTLLGTGLRPAQDLLTGAPAGRGRALHALLQQEIVLGRLKQRAVVLELELAQRFGVSQGTVREALMRLHEEGLVHRLPNRGTTVADCRAMDAEELIRLRHDIECRGLRRSLTAPGSRFAGAEIAAELATELEAMREAAQDGDEYLLSLHDRAFHLKLYAHADMPVIEPVLTRTLIHVHRYKILHPTQGRDLVDTANRHAGIVEAVAEGDLERALSALSHHITTIVDLGPSILEPAPAQGSQG